MLVRGELHKTRPLVCGVPYKIGNREPVIIRFKYERLQLFCYRCGYLDHVDKDCEQEESKDQMVHYGSFMRASPAKAGN